MIEIKNVSFSYGKGIHNGITDINVDIKKGEFVAIIGPSGSGKTTFINVMANVLNPTEGTILVEGKSLQSCKKNISVMFQNGKLIPWWSLEKNILFFAQKSDRSLSKESAHKKTRAVLKAIGLEKDKNKFPSELSGGMQQRGTLGRVFATKSDLLLLDEPFGALDVNNRYQLQDMLSELAYNSEKTIIMVTHDINEALYLADKILFFKNGRIIKVFSNPLGHPRKRDVVMDDKWYIETKKDMLEMFCCE